MKLADIEKRPPRVPRPPPKPSAGSPVGANTSPSTGAPPPPPGAPPPPPPPPPPGGPPHPPPPPGSLSRGAGSGDKVHRAPEAVEFYWSLMKREAKKETSSLISSTSNASDAKSNMIGEIEDRSSFLLAVLQLFAFVSIYFFISTSNIGFTTQINGAKPYVWQPRES
ncbi:hypothetical protein P3X46_031291 [Hevea brasiliensis]|uniref:Uncharacterized protein n=1 Tax=Hevea brasiliensis TaxID=3981 RepID=A0ABQ9KKL9_HEVBR|nr:hypothetical protein P3X46_031291 [Hevea brasiliensis]